jgi:hypothetical protein
MNLEYCITKNGSDKVRSGYNNYYSPLFDPLQHTLSSILEIGIGSKLDVPSTMAGTPDPNYKPGASLRAWRDYFLKAQVTGIDVGEDCKFEEERIKTHIFSSLDKIKADQELGDSTFDVILDDGLHTAFGQIITLQNFFSRVKDGGYYIVEDLGGGGDGMNMLVELEKEFRKIADEHEWFWVNSNLCIIRKNYSKKGKIESFEEFLNTPKPTSVIVEETPVSTLPVVSNTEEIPVDSFDPSLLGKLDSLSTEERENLIKYLKSPRYVETNNKELTVVTGLWNIGRPGRDFDHYIEHFKYFLEMPYNMFIFIPAEYEYLVWEKRSKKNTYVKILELDDLKNNYYANFWERTQNIRTNPDWFNQTGEQGWLVGSPQAHLEWYNPIVQSKMFMLSDASIWDPFSSEYFIWLDAGISNTVYYKYFSENKVLDKINPYLDSFLFLSYPYETTSEIHGFNKQEMDKLAGVDVKYVCRGGLFGGRKEIIREANADYYTLLDGTLSRGLMGTEESIFSIMANVNPRLYKRYALDGNGLIVKFAQALKESKVELVPVEGANMKVKARNPSLAGIKTSLYMLTFNFPKQVEHTINTWVSSDPEWLSKPHRKILIDNSNKPEAIEENKLICEKYGFEHIVTGENLGINRGRQFAAEHFHESDSDFYFFFEDDMGFYNQKDNGFCRNGFRKFVPGLYDKVHKIMLREQFDFMKLSYTEVYMDNNIQVSWYNVPQTVRSRDWPDYDKLPISGLDPNAPRTKFKHIEVFEDLSYISGDIYYANWPMIVGREGNKKMFIDTTWAHPWEQTWMSHMYQETIAGNLNPAVLLASPVWHNRILYYEPHERREN